jgi:hypothetical protein
MNACVDNIFFYNMFFILIKDKFFTSSSLNAVDLKRG